MPKQTKKPSFKNKTLVEVLTKYHINDHQSLENKINEIKNLKVGDLIEVKYKFSYPPKVVGLIINVENEIVEIYSNISRRMKFNRNLLISDLNDDLMTNMWISVISKVE